MTAVRRRLLAAAMIATSAMTWGAVAPAGAAKPSLLGWWQQAQQLPVGLPAPPNVPAGGLYVANTPAGPGAIAALRFSSAEPAPAVLKLVVNANSAPLASVAAINACIALSDWKGTQNGPWAEAPTYSCATPAKAKLESDGATMDWEIPADFQGADFDYVDVVLVPDAAANPFQLAIDPPTEASWVQGEAAGTKSTPPPDPEPFFEPAPDASGAFLPAEPLPAFSFVGDVNLPPVPVPGPVADHRPRQNIPLARAVPAGAFKDRERWQRIEATLALLAIAAAWFWLTGETTRMPRLLGTVGGAHSRRTRAPAVDPVRGIGRFSRPRTGRPPKIG